MKNIRLIIIISLAMLYGCTEPQVGQYPVDDTPPQEVTVTKIENLAGKVVVSYKLPNESDLLYVKAVYVDAKGATKEVRASMFKNRLEISGFGRSLKRSVQLISVDRSRNESAPVVIEVEPQDSPIYNVAEMMDVSSSWGGAVFKWENTQNETFVVKVYKEDNGNLFELDTFYSSETNAIRSIRGMESSEQSIAVVVNDIYGNSSDMMTYKIIPWFEVELPYDDFVVMPFPDGIAYSKRYHKGGDKALFDNLINDVNSVFYLEPGVPPQPFFSVNLNHKCALSRMKMWQRTNSKQAFVAHNPHYFEIWGTDDELATRDPNNWEGWVKLLDCESVRPSGLGPDVIADGDDLAYAQAGEDFEFAAGTMPVRFFRFRSIENWGKSTALHMGEIRLWGIITE